MDRKVVVNQEGMHQCSICGNKFEWRLKIEILNIDGFEEKYGRVASVIETRPDKYINFKLISNEKMVVNIVCPKCGYMSETEKMQKIKGVNLL